MELHRGTDGQYAEQQQGNELSHLEWRLRLRRGNLLQRRYLHEKLYYQDKDVEIERYHGGDHIGAAPTACELKTIARQDRYRQCDERQNADRV